MPDLSHFPRHYVPLAACRRMLSTEEVPCAAPAAPKQLGREIAAPEGRKLLDSRGDLGSAGPRR